MTHETTVLSVHATLAAVGFFLWWRGTRSGNGTRSTLGGWRSGWRGLPEKARWSALDLVLLLLGYVALGSLGQTLKGRWGIADGSVGVVGLAAGIGAGLSLLVVCLIAARGQGGRALGIERAACGRAASRGALWFLLAYPAVYGALLLSHAIFSWRLGDEPAMNPAAVLFLQGRPWPDQAAVVAFAGIVAPVVEEVLYRGFLYGLARRTLSPLASAAIVSAVFALGHPPVDWAPIFLLGVALSFAYEESGTLLAPIFAHGLNNLYGLSLLAWERAARGG